MITYLNGTAQTYKRWEYNARGRTTLIGQSPAGVTTDLGYTYDSGDRISTMIYYEAGETVTYEYDAGWRPKTLCSSLAGQNCYVTNATYTALDQPNDRTTGNGVTQDWGYDATTARLSSLLVSKAANVFFQRSYAYDAADNVTSISDALNAANNQTYGYDERDRLTCWKLNASSCTQSYSYDALGNLMSKTGVGAYQYGSNLNGSGVGPHQARVVGGAIIGYDANGNMSSRNGWSYSWYADNTLASLGNGSYTETYTYDADGERVVRTAGGVTTVYFEGVWEQTTAGARKLYYTFNGQAVAMRDSTMGVVTYLHGAHLGSVSVATDSAGTSATTQEFDPWGAVRSGGIGATSMNYTGQRLDATGLAVLSCALLQPGASTVRQRG